MNHRAAGSQVLIGGFPRRKRAARPHAGSASRPAGLGCLSDLAGGAAVSEALDVARYVADMAAQLEAMSEAADLDLLAYFLSMAKAEAETFLQRSRSATGEPAGEDGGWSVEGREPG